MTDDMTDMTYMLRTLVYIVVKMVSCSLLWNWYTMVDINWYN